MGWYKAGQRLYDHVGIRFQRGGPPRELRVGMGQVSSWHIILKGLKSIPKGSLPRLIGTLRDHSGPLRPGLLGLIGHCIGEIYLDSKSM